MAVNNDDECNIFSCNSDRKFVFRGQSDGQTWLTYYKQDGAQCFAYFERMNFLSLLKININILALVGCLYCKFLYLYVYVNATAAFHFIWNDIRCIFIGKHMLHTNVFIITHNTYSTFIGKTLIIYVMSQRKRTNAFIFIIHTYTHKDRVAETV